MTGTDKAPLGGPFHELRYKALRLEQPYTGHLPPRLPRTVAAELATIYTQIADEAQRMGWTHSERDYRAQAELARAYAEGRSIQA